MGINAEQPQGSRILIVDDHPLFREGLRELILREPGWLVCGEAADATEALRLVAETKPDLVIVDISLGQTNGLELIKTIGAKETELPMLVVSMHDESLYSELAILAGAMGYVMKHEPPTTVKTAIRRVLAGEMYLSHNMAMSMVAKLTHGDTDKPKETPQDLLSERELEVFRLIGNGKDTRKIALELNISVATINSFRARIKEKLHLESSTELILKAINWVREQAELKLPFSP
jgi:DNA-binding NarL/FixJ family response regulator